MIINSLKQLYLAPYNRAHPLFALHRFIIWKFIRLFHIKNFQYSLWSNKKIILHYNNQQSAWLMYNYWVDWEEFNLIKDIVQENDIVFDVGANMGFYTIWMSRFIKVGGKIHCFEPDEESYKRLIKNIQINKLGSLVVSNKIAISEQNKVVKFTKRLDGENHILNHSTHEFNLISSATIDEYVNDNNILTIKYLKIDIEGFEYQALLGAINALKSGKIEIIQLEINSQIQNSGTTINELLNFIYSTNYLLCSYDPKSQKLTPIEYSTNRENYFMVRSERISV